MRKWINLIESNQELDEFQMHDVEKMLTIDGGNDDPPEPPEDDDEPGRGEEPGYNFHDINDVKRYFFDRSRGKNRVQKWWIQPYDGAFQRPSFIVEGNEDDFPEMARVMTIWNRFYENVAIFAQSAQRPRASLKYGRPGQLLLIWLDGQPLPEPIVMPDSDSSNANHFNDSQWLRRLPEILDKVREKEKP